MKFLFLEWFQFQDFDGFFSSFETIDSVELAKDYIFQTMVSKVDGEGGRDRARTVTSFHVVSADMRRYSVGETSRERANSSATAKLAANDPILNNIKNIQKQI